MNFWWRSLPKSSESRIQVWLRSNIWVVLILIVILVNGGLAYFNFVAPRPSQTPMTPPGVSPVNPIPAGEVASSLNGEYLPEAIAMRRPYAVMVDNLPAARPAAGLSQASVVWETLVEGGVTRLMPIFQTTDDVVIGPVRSARDYFLPWVHEVAAIYVHSGGSVVGLAALKAEPLIPDADEFHYGSAFYRAPGVAKPHDLFTSINRLFALATKQAWVDGATFAPATVSDDQPSPATAAKHITINFSTPAYRVEWTWDEAASSYRRVNGGLIAVDRNSQQQLTAKNVIVLFTSVALRPPPNPQVAVDVTSLGSGDAWFFRNGLITKGTWEKLDSGSRLVLKNSDRTPYNLARGQVWMEVVPTEKDKVVVVK